MYSCGMFLRKCGSLGELRHWGFSAFLVVYLTCYIFVTVKEVTFGEGYVLEFCGGTYSEVWQGKSREAVPQIKSVYGWYLDLVVKCLRCIKCFGYELCHFLKSPEKTYFLFRADWTYLSWAGVTRLIPSSPTLVMRLDLSSEKISIFSKVSKNQSEHRTEVQPWLSK